MICHGIPDGYVLQSGDIINVDVTTIVNGWHGDSPRRFSLGRWARRLGPSRNARSIACMPPLMRSARLPRVGDRGDDHGDRRGTAFLGGSGIRGTWIGMTVPSGTLHSALPDAPIAAGPAAARILFHDRADDNAGKRYTSLDSWMAGPYGRVTASYRPSSSNRC